MSENLCEITELAKDQCAHCRKVPELGFEVEPDGAIPDEDAHSGKEVLAQFVGFCGLCKERIEIGDWIHSNNMGWVHEVCP